MCLWALARMSTNTRPPADGTAMDGASMKRLAHRLSVLKQMILESALLQKLQEAAVSLPCPAPCLRPCHGDEARYWIGLQRDDYNMVTVHWTIANTKGVDFISLSEEVVLFRDLGLFFES